MEKHTIWSVLSRERTQGRVWRVRAAKHKVTERMEQIVHTVLAEQSARGLQEHHPPAASPTAFDHSPSKETQCLGCAMPSCPVCCPGKEGLCQHCPHKPFFLPTPIPATCKQKNLDRSEW